ncbi:MAG: synthase subcomplex subunit [Chthonomonadaceae bacterium]|nr:synthase subcomplex subunit [Chthonomonadaceae bacterium]
MPQTPQEFQVHPDSRPGQPILIARGGQEPGQVAGEAHTAEKPKEEDAGKIPDAPMLFGNSLVVAAILVGFALLARSKKEAVPRGFQNFAEQVVESLNYFTVGIIGHGGERYTPLVGTVFLYILLCNLIGIIPGLHSPTANLSTTLALGVIVFLYVQYEGIRTSGPVNYIKHFMGPMPALAPLMFPVELISELVKPFTLAVRLFGNIFGEDVILVVLAGLGLELLHVPGLPLHFPVLFLSVITAVVQAMVFSMLTCIYLSLMAHHDHEGPNGEEGAIDAAHAH